MALRSPARPRSTLLSLVVLWVAFYASFTLFAPALLDDADSVHAEVAREMLVRHDYVTLYANGIRYLEKAPLLYWSMALSFKVFGVSTAAARVPLALTVLALALLVEAFARRAFRSARAGLYAGLILLSSPGMFLFSRINLPDAMVCLWLTVAMYCFWVTEEREAPSIWLTCGFGAACALNVLTKGLIGIVFPVGIIGVYLLLERGVRGAGRRVRQLNTLRTLVVFVVIAVPWHVLIALANPTQGHPGGLGFVDGHFTVSLPTDGNVHGWLWFYFVNEQVLRYINLRVPRDYDTVPLWLFWGLCVVWLMPWSAFAFRAFAWRHPLRHAVLRTTAQRRKVFQLYRRVGIPSELHVPLLLIVWTGFVVVFFSLSTRQEYYVLPAFPAVAILLGGWLAQDSLAAWQPITQKAKRVRRANIRITAVLVSLGGIFAVAAGVFLIRSHAARTGEDLAQLLQQNPGDYAMSMGHFLDLNARALGLFRLPLVVAVVSLFVGPAISFALRKRGRSHAATLMLAGGAFGFLLAVHLGLQRFAPVLSSQQLAAVIAPQVRADDLVVIHQEYEYGSTLGFYLQRNDLHILEGRSSNLWYGSFFPDAPPIFETTQTLAARWGGPQRIWVWQDLATQPSALPVLPAPIYVIAKSGGKEIVSNRPGR